VLPAMQNIQSVTQFYQVTTTDELNLILCYNR